jgi:hypothetical protein
MAMSLINGGIRSQAIEVTLAFDVLDPHALRTLNDHIERAIVVGSVQIFQVDKFLSASELIQLLRGHGVLSSDVNQSYDRSSWAIEPCRRGSPSVGWLAALA